VSASTSTTYASCGLGIFKLLIGSWATLGTRPLVDVIIALVKLGKYRAQFIFDNAGQWVEPAAL
jgi:hypothetical protein